MNKLIQAFVVLVFVAVLLMMQGLVAPRLSSNSKIRKRLRRRIADLEGEEGKAGQSLLRRQYLEKLSPLQRRLEDMPGMHELRNLMGQAGLDFPAHLLVLQALGLGAIAAIVTIVGGLGTLGALLLGAIGGAAPFVRLTMLRSKRLNTIEEQLPDAIDVIKRSVSAGHPFIVAMKLVGEDMEAPIGPEFATTAADFSFGSDPRAALMSLANRVPSLAMMEFVTAVLIQRETGGNLAEILENSSQVIRGRAQFQRKIRTLSAEGRISAWVLTLIPFGLALVLQLTTPHYLQILFKSEQGLQMLAACGVLMVLGIFWMQRIIRIEI